MPVPPELVAIVACPRCKGKLVLRDDGSAFECPACRVAYAIENDIPNFLIDEATPLGR